ncbi:MAG TPA: hypothetical protein VI282_05370 [Verrucomicrobiae bacterium]
MHSELTSEEYEVYSCVLQHKYWKRGRELVIGSRVMKLNRILYDRLFTLHQSIEWWQKEFPGLLAETAVDLLSFKKSNGVLTPKLNVSAPYLILSDEQRIDRKNKQISGDERSDGWKEFHEEHPSAGSLIVLSRAGFDGGKTQALVAVTDVVGGLAAGCRLWFLNKQDSKWNLIGDVLLWIS